MEMKDQFLTNPQDVDSYPWATIPENLRAGLRRYVIEGTPTGHFLTAVLQDKLFEAYRRADGGSAVSMKEILNLVYNYFPGDSWGSPEKVTAWVKRGEELRSTEEI